MLVLDLETGCVEELFDGARYTESLAHINGMEKVVVKNEQNDLNVCS
ncbi:hypothetical protein CASFOL_013198 [Castilleja foliolosa]|uniref:Uncharacterized protein n=1 Tax=Castilleja foliolosa TaxID=1961234 RepID=A0ABD3DJF4_9LAMI